MCGIAGFLSNTLSQKDLERMTEALVHRGPDAAGYFYDQQSAVGLGHRRLSILDTSEAANQPFHSHCDRYAMVYNGEVYNFKTIKSQIDRDWKTSGDTEVILEAFVAWGSDFVNQLNGMFAIAIWDKQEQKLWLFRDRMGIKPLYYYHEDDHFYFGSEIKAIKALNVPLSIDQRSIRQFLHLGYVGGEKTFFMNVLKLPAGHYGFFQDGKWSIQNYWRAEDQLAPATVKHELAAKKQLKELIFASVERRMLSDVPLGTFLSGGIDSSLVTAVAQELSARPIQSFSIGFKESTSDESKYAKRVADHLGTAHQALMVSESDALEVFDHILEMFDQPFADSSAIPTYIVSKLASKEVKVALSGDGGDELFMGYGMYDWAARLSNPWLKITKQPLAALLKKFGNNRMKRGADVINYESIKNIKSHIFSQEQYLFNQYELSDLLLSKAASVESIDTLDIDVRKLSAKEQQAFFDLKNYLKDDLLHKVDIASMQNSLEVRVPLLDHQVVAFALNLDESLKVHQGDKKYLLKQVLYDFVPKSFFDRPKGGFSIPLERWLQKELRYLIDDYLSTDVINEVGIVNVAAVEKLKQRFFSGESFLYNRLWVLILLHKWFINNKSMAKYN